MTRGGGMRPRLVVMIRRNGRVRGSSMLIWYAVGFGVDVVVVGDGYAVVRDAALLGYRLHRRSGRQ